MKTANYFIVVLLLLNCCTTKTEIFENDYPITPVDFTQVKLQEGFWKEWVDTVHNATLPYAFNKCKETGRINNFIFAGGLNKGKYEGKFGFNDSDLYKIMEGAAYSLMTEYDDALNKYLDTLILYISAAQEDDGYLYTPWSLKANDYTNFYCCTYDPEGKWKGTSESSHELYNAGHMYEAAVAHFLATGKRSFLDIAIKNADLVYDVIIKQGNSYAPGHQEIEIGLVKLYRVSKDRKYLDLAKHLLDIRSIAIEGSYAQGHLPVTEQLEAVGHAVRANYMYTAMADIAALTGNSAYLTSIDSIWENVIQKKLSVTGSVGAKHEGEAYGNNYELPNNPYNETCAAIANVYWNHRMFMLHGDSKYIDVLERTLYNGVITGLSLDGKLFFYPNTLRHDGKENFNRGVNGRSPWFDCSCCPSNLSRFIPSVAGYAYAVNEDKIYFNLYMNSKIETQTKNGSFQARVETNYPMGGKVRIDILSDLTGETELYIRIPGWAEDRPFPSDLFSYVNPATLQTNIKVNDETIEPERKNGYALIKKRWSAGDKIELNFPMESRILQANELVKAKTNLLAVQYGPLIYCAEEIDNEQDVLASRIKRNDEFQATYIPELLNGIVVLQKENLNLIPYYAWANRGRGKMNVWFEAD